MTKAAHKKQLIERLAGLGKSKEDLSYLIDITASTLAMVDIYDKEAAVTPLTYTDGRGITRESPVHTNLRKERAAAVKYLKELGLTTLTAKTLKETKTASKSAQTVDVLGDLLSGA